MRIDLKDLLREDGAIPFAYALDLGDMDFPSITRFLLPLRAEGRISSQAGFLSLTGSVKADLLCVCDRCGSTYTWQANVPLDTVLVDEHQDAEDPDVYVLTEGGVELDEVVTTAFVLGLDSKMLCRPDCKGVCPRCGKDLNEGPCACKPETDSRLAVLQQLFQD